MSKKIILITLGLIFALYSKPWAEEKVGALGRIQPGGGIIHMAGPPGDTIAAINVKEGDFIEKGEPLVTLASGATYKAEVSLAKIALEKVDKLGQESIALQELKVADILKRATMAIVIQELKIKKAKEDYDFALRRLKRLDAIGSDTFSAQQAEVRRYDVEKARINMSLVEQGLKKLERDRDLNLASTRRELKRLRIEHEINVKQAQQDLEMARKKLKSSVLRAPMGGTVLEILQNVGERTGGQTLIKMADLRQMYVVAEIFEADLLKISPGMKATITSNSLPSPLNGQVESIGRIISDNSKITKVKIRLIDSEVASKLINLEVNVSIDL